MTDITGAQKKLKAIEKRSRELPWDDVTDIMKKSIAQNFALGGRYGSERSFEGGSRTWEKRKVDKPWPILNKTGALMNQITYKALKRSLQIVSSLPYSAAHQFGFPKRNLASRPFIVFHDEDRNSIAPIFRKHLAKKK